jgi:N6-L-threonylcarbamoyladenine synthase
MNILGIETSCDETAAAMVKDGRRILKSVVASQWAVHRPFRGVVPELASRSHVERINETIEEATRHQKTPIDAIAVTTGPGLIGCLLVGAVTARTWAWVRQIPVVGVNHLEGHLFAGLVEHPQLKPPFLGLIVSGGHTELVIFRGYGRYDRLGATRDDAAGEAFDKVANLLHLPFPGGPAIDQMARRGQPDKIRFPRAWIPGTFDFSFSGIKTSMAQYLENHGRPSPAQLPDVCASFQEAIVDGLVKKSWAAAERHGLRSIVVGGGVAANSRLRQRFLKEAAEKNIRVYLPDLSFCTDNAVMIASAGYYKLRYGKKNSSMSVDANLAIQSWKAA